MSDSAIVKAELRQFIERAEEIALEKSALSDQEKELFAEAKGRGFDVKALRKLISLRKRDPEDVAEEDAILDMYKAAMGMD